MSPSPLLAALLLLAPAARADDSSVAGKAVYSISGCKDDADRKTMEDNIGWVAERVQKCLATLGPAGAKSTEIAKKILQRYAGFKYACAYDPSVEGGHTKVQSATNATITMDFVSQPGIKQYDFAPRLFHELIHAVDTQYELMGNRKAHSTPGNTDAVYGCQLACYTDGIGDWELKMYKHAGSGVPDAPKSYDPTAWMDPANAFIMKDSDHLWAAQTYAAICVAGHAFVGTKSLDSSCLAGKIADGCPRGKDKAFCETDAAESNAYCRLRCDAGGDDQSTVNAAIPAADAIVKAIKEKDKPLTGENASLLKQLQRDKLLTACNK